MNKSNNGHESIRHEVKLMLAAAYGDTTTTQYMLQEPVDWELLLHLLIYHQVYPLVYKTFNELGNGIPEGFMISLRNLWRENMLMALKLTGETVRMVDCFQQNNIRLVVLKGMPLAHYLYGHIGLRPSSDIDIVVLDDRLELINQIMEEQGYHKTEPAIGLTPRQREIYAKTYPHPHHVAYWHDKRETFLEIHWDMGQVGQVVLPMPTETSINRIQMAAGSLPVLADEEWLLYLILHGSSHVWFRLRWLVDIAKFMQRDINWEKVQSLAQRLGMQSILYHGLILANSLLGVPLPPSCQSSLLSDRNAGRLSSVAIKLCLSLSEHRLGVIEGDYNNYWCYVYNYQMRVGWRNRVNYILSLCRPTIGDIRLISLPDPLYPFYYVIRPFTFLCGIFAMGQKTKAR